MFSRFDTIHETDGQTDGRTPHDSVGRAMRNVARKNSPVQRKNVSNPFCKLKWNAYVNVSSLTVMQEIGE